MYTGSTVSGVGTPAAAASALNCHTTEKPDTQIPDKIKEDEVTSSEEAFKLDCTVEEQSNEGIYIIIRN